MKKTKSSRPRAKRRNNPGLGALLAKLTGGGAQPHRRKRSGRKRGHSKRNRGHRSNPGRVSGMSASKLLRGGVVAFLSGMAVREGTQAVLGGKNTGAVGYGVNLLLSGVAYMLAGAIGRREDALAAGIGGVASVATRVWTESANRVGTITASPVAGIGDTGTFAARRRAESFLQATPPQQPGLRAQ